MAYFQIKPVSLKKFQFLESLRKTKYGKIQSIRLWITRNQIPLPSTHNFSAVPQTLHHLKASQRQTPSSR